MILVLIVYGWAVAAGGFAFTFWEGTLLTRMLVGDVVATAAVLMCSLIYRNASFADPFWSIAPMVMVPTWWVAEGHLVANTTRVVLLLIAVGVWGLRLTWNWASQWRGLGDEDWRYRQLREEFPHIYLIINIFGLHFFRAGLVFLGLLPAWAVTTQMQTATRWTDWLALIVCLAGAALELVADAQMRAFRANRDNDGLVLDQGLWAYSRHPNYFGEALFWLGVALFVLPNFGAFWWTHVGWIAIFCLIWFLSILIMEVRSQARRPAYPAYMERTSRLFLWWKKHG